MSRRKLFLLSAALGGGAALWYGLRRQSTSTPQDASPRIAEGITLPQTMAALELRDHTFKSDSLAMVEKALPQPGPEEVLVRIAASPINPSDLMFIKGQYGITKSLPTVPGFEASGTVVASGGGLWGRSLLGRRVTCAAQGDFDGTWAEYAVLPARSCLPLASHVSDEQGAMVLVNPLTAWALIDIAQRQGHKAIVHTAGAGALGRMLLRVGQRMGLPIIHIVRRPEQADYLRQLGAEHVLDSSREVFAAELEFTCRQLGATLAFDAVAGDMLLTLMQAMPKDARILVYGALSEQAGQVDPRRLIFGGQRVEGFWLTQWVQQTSLAKVGLAVAAIQRLIDTDFRSDIHARVPLTNFKEALELYTSEMSAGKVLLMPGLTQTEILDA